MHYTNQKRSNIDPLLIKKYSDFLMEKVNNPSLQITSLFIKTYMSCILPFPSKDIIEADEVDNKLLTEQIAKIDLKYL